MRKVIILFFLVSVILTTGCSDREQTQPSLEDLALASSMGFDLGDHGEMKMTIGIPLPPNDSPVPTQVFSIHTNMIQEGLVKLSSESDKMIVLNQLRTLLFSEEFARSGKVTEVVQHLYRDSTLGNNVRLVIVKDDVEDVLSGNYSENEHMDAYLNDLFQPNLHNSFSPFTSIHDYMNTQTSPVYHTMIPYLEKKEDVLKITKIALFDNKKMIDTISTEKSLLIQALSGVNKLSPISVTFHGNEIDKEAFLEQIDSKVKISSNKSTETPKVAIELKIKAVLIEYKGDRDLTNSKQYKKLEKEINAHLKEEVEDTLQYLQEMELDPVGISEYFRMYYKGKWTEELTRKVTSDLDYNVTVNLKIRNTGTLR
ncbi:Ger(x)C family spore germination protein [Sporosarcina sp. BI001-red]|uniref:Ger(x)C family spore germination protein n=1 Tax=Sporosarcina sp. BI001-red TaxID=2282866 RepID=UPI000E232430|nr:Ger(x)C family spore germination protein [Sporosarcina sp. BI001-red]REB05509.1 Ger(x)C family spore germination protein [Sporosarcina sp. BI001-red]